MLVTPFLGCAFDMVETIIAAYITYNYSATNHTQFDGLVLWHSLFVRAKWITLMVPLFFALAGLAFRPVMLIFSLDKPKQS